MCVSFSTEPEPDDRAAPPLPGWQGSRQKLSQVRILIPPQFSRATLELQTRVVEHHEPGRPSLAFIATFGA
jgi:hypothetical protein